jgi:putative nucleotidyltransferase with HDIG domain
MGEVRANVLVADDDEHFGTMVADVLAEYGHRVTRCLDPREAVEAVRHQLFDVAIVDLHMPHMNGHELVSRLARDSPDTQIVMLTGQGDVQSAREGIRQGVHAYLEKGDLKPVALAQAVQGAVEKGQLRHRNRELLRRLQDSNRLLRSLQASGTGLFAERRLDTLLPLLTDSAKEACRATGARAMLFDTGPEGDLVIATAAGSETQTLQGTRLGRSEGIVTLAALADQTIAVEDPRAHPRFSLRADAITASPGYICAPMRHGKVLGALVVAGSERGVFTVEELEILTALARQAAVAVANTQEHERFANFFAHTSDLLISLLESLDIHYPGHSRGVAALSDMVTRRIGLGEAERRDVHFGALLHDIGKVRTDPAVLRGKGPLSDEARRALQAHPTLGAEMLKPIAAWEGAVAIIHAHHERWDGGGYPRGLAGDDIPFGARIVAVADAFDAMSRATPFTRARTLEERLAELRAHAGTQFDARIVDAFIAAILEHGDPRGPA